MKVRILLLLLDVSAGWAAKSVADFGFVTWNADGGQHWNAAKHYFLQSAVDLMAIQAAGELPHEPLGAVPRHASTPTKFLGASAAKPSCAIDEYLWNVTERDQLHLYYYGCPPTAREPQPSLAILSRHQAHKLFVLPTSAAADAHLMALRIESALFLTFGGGDAAAVVGRVANLTAAHHATLTWALMGDFERTPAQLSAALAHPPTDTFRRLVATGAATRIARPPDRRHRPAVAYRKHRRPRKHPRRSQPAPRTLASDDETRPPTATAPFEPLRRKHRKRLRAARRQSWRRAAASREVDYAVFGGPAASRHIMKSVNVELLGNYLARLGQTRYARNPSRHLPLIFNQRL